MMKEHQRPSPATVRHQERPVLPTGGLRRTGRLAALPVRHVARSAAAASRLSRAARVHPPYPGGNSRGPRSGRA
jgi:hypothetical protein